MTTTLPPAPAPAPIPWRGPARPRKAPSSWWLSPVAVICLVVPLSVAATFYVGPEVFSREYRMPKVITADVLLLFLAGGMALALGAAIAGALRPPAPRGDSWPLLNRTDTVFLGRVSTVLYRITLVGYLGFVLAGFLRGITLQQLVAAVTTDEIYEVTFEDQLGTIPGLTTLTQVGMASVCVSALLLCRGSGGRREIIRIAVLVGLSVLRAFLLTERLAVLELVIPLVVLFAARSSVTPRGRRRVALVPVVAAPLMLVIFGAFEYTRSWVFYRQFGGSFASFVVERLAGYYVTAYNNGYLQMKYASPPGHWPSGIANALWRAPGIEELDLLNQLNGFDQKILTEAVLTQYGNPEFNNLSGVGIVFSDLGVIGGFGYLLVSGVIAGLMYTAFCESRMWGILLYPTIFIGLLEIPRVLYWAEGRSLPTYLAIGILLIFYRRRSRRERLTGKI